MLTSFLLILIILQYNLCLNVVERRIFSPLQCVIYHMSAHFIVLLYDISHVQIGELQQQGQAFT